MQSYTFFSAGIDEEVDALYLKIKNTFGISFVPNFFKMIANHKDVFKGIWKAYENILANGELPLQIKELIFLYTALEKGCNYCSSTHLAVCDMLDVTMNNLEGLKNNIDKVTPKEVRAVLMLVHKTIRLPESITQEDYTELKKLDFSNAEISEILCMTHLANTAVGLALISGLKEIEPEIEDYLKDHNLTTGLS